jgi:hypothetical protein
LAVRTATRIEIELSRYYHEAVDRLSYVDALRELVGQVALAIVPDDEGKVTVTRNDQDNMYALWVTARSLAAVLAGAGLAPENALTFGIEVTKRWNASQLAEILTKLDRFFKAVSEFTGEENAIELVGFDLGSDHWWGRWTPRSMLTMAFLGASLAGTAAYYEVGQANAANEARELELKEKEAERQWQLIQWATQNVDELNKSSKEINWAHPRAPLTRDDIARLAQNDTLRLPFFDVIKMVGIAPSFQAPEPVRQALPPGRCSSKGGRADSRRWYAEGRLTSSNALGARAHSARAPRGLDHSSL